LKLYYSEAKIQFTLTSPRGEGDQRTDTGLSGYLFLQFIVPGSPDFREECLAFGFGAVALISSFSFHSSPPRFYFINIVALLKDNRRMALKRQNRKGEKTLLNVSNGIKS
jgi:hypothetical protein